MKLIIISMTLDATASLRISRGNDEIYSKYLFWHLCFNKCFIYRERNVIGRLVVL